MTGYLSLFVSKSMSSSNKQVTIRGELLHPPPLYYTASTHLRVVGSLVTISITKLSVIWNPSISSPTLRVCLIAAMVGWSALIVSPVSGSIRLKTPNDISLLLRVATGIPASVVTLLLRADDDTITVALFLAALMFTFLKNTLIIIRIKLS